jgi:hypothetical protein
MIGTIARVIARWRGSEVVIAAELDSALLASAAALRRLGARITRYDGEAGTLEAEVARRGVIRLRAAAAPDGTTRVELDGDPAARPVIRRFRAALSA